MIPATETKEMPEYIMAPTSHGQSDHLSNYTLMWARSVSRKVSQQEWAFKILDSDSASRLPRGYRSQD